MANRYPLVINNSTSLVGELSVGDSLNLTASGIYDGISTGANKQVLTSTGTEVRWARAADVFLNDNQTLLNKTLSSCTFNASLNTLTNVANASLLNSSVNINGTDVHLGGSITIPDTNDNTIYGISVADGTAVTQKRIRLTAGGSGSGVQDIFLVAGYNTTITRSGNDTLEIATGLTQLRAPDSSPYIEGQITFAATGGTRISQNLQTITIDSDPFPIGGIIMWSGSVNNIPAKWAICNGDTVNGVATPDLRNRFVIGAGENYGVNSTGGSKDAVVISHNHTGTTSTESQSHTHSGTTSTESRSHTHSGTTGDNSVGHTHPGTTGTESASHSHGANASSTGSAHSHPANSGTANAPHSHPVSVGSGGGSHSHPYTWTNGINTGSAPKDGQGNPVVQSVGRNTGNATTGPTGIGHSHPGNANSSSAPHSHPVTVGSGGAHSHPVTVNNNTGTHTHNFTTGGVSSNHTHSFNTGNTSQTHTHTITTGNTSQSHTHTITVSTEGVAGTDKNLPPYYALAYIIKVE